MSLLLDVCDVDVETSASSDEWMATLETLEKASITLCSADLPNDEAIQLLHKVGKGS